jgi:hypothetical protein
MKLNAIKYLFNIQKKMTYTTDELSNTIHTLSISNNMQVYVKYIDNYYSITEIVNCDRDYCVVINAHGVSSSYSADNVIESLNEYSVKNLYVLFSVGLYNQIICNIYYICVENECIIIYVNDMK